MPCHEECSLQLTSQFYARLRWNTSEKQISKITGWYNIRGYWRGSRRHCLKRCTSVQVLLLCWNMFTCRGFVAAVLSILVGSISAILLGPAFLRKKSLWGTNAGSFPKKAAGNRAYFEQKRFLREGSWTTGGVSYEALPTSFLGKFLGRRKLLRFTIVCPAL